MYFSFLLSFKLQITYSAVIRYNFFILIISLFAISSCTSKQDSSQTETAPIDTAAVIQEGKTIVQSTFTTLSSNLSGALKEGDVAHALQFCNVEAMPLTDSLSTHYGIEIRRASHRPRNPQNQADSLELASIQSYIDQLEKDGELKPIVHNRRGQILFHAPIRIAGDLCLNCHGSPGTDIAQTDLEVIRELYPEDEATGFEMGELRGIWSIGFPESYFTDNSE